MLKFLLYPLTPSYKWRVVLMLWFISFFNYADRQAIFSVFPLVEREMQLTPATRLARLGVRLGLRPRRLQASSSIASAG